jgi:hypothetical protein
MARGDLDCSTDPLTLLNKHTYQERATGDCNRQWKHYPADPFFDTEKSSTSEHRLHATSKHKRSRAKVFRDAELLRRFTVHRYSC